MAIQGTLSMIVVVVEVSPEEDVGEEVVEDEADVVAVAAAVAVVEDALPC